MKSGRSFSTILKEERPPECERLELSCRKGRGDSGISAVASDNGKSWKYERDSLRVAINVN